MRYCLNPGNPHKLVDLPATPSSTFALLASEREQSVTEELATCRYCKYVLEGALLGDCRVTRWLGSGTFGDVYEAEQLPPLRRRVAIKVMSLEHVVDGKTSEIFAREVSVVATLDHPHIMPVLRVGTLPDGRPYLVMKFAAHGSLQKFCRPLQSFTSFAASASHTHTPPQAMRGKPTVPLPIPTPEEIAQYRSTQALQIEQHAHAPTSAMSQRERSQTGALLTTEPHAPARNLPAAARETYEILTAQQLLPYLENAAQALQYAHEHDIIHLDVKPANLLLDAEDRVMLADFGVSTLLEGYTHASLRGYVGTPLYTAPEQWLEQPRAASDQYALAVTCYQLLTGRVPFIGNLYSIMHGHIQEVPPPLRSFQAQIPTEVEDVILRALAKDPAARYPDIRTFAQAYRAAVEQAAYATYLATSDDLLSATHIPTTEKPDPVEDGLLHPLVAITSPHAHVETMTASPPTKHRSARLHPPHGIKRTLTLLLFALLLLSGGTFGATYAVNSCTFGSCPHPSLTLSNTTVHLLNDETQTIQLRNTSKGDLHWSATLEGSPSWLTLSSSGGLLHTNQAYTLAFRSHSDGLPSGTNTALVIITGPGLIPQYIAVTVQVQAELNAVHVNVSGTTFAVQQGSPNLPTQTITITNHSGQSLSWWSMYSQQSWLIVSPDQGTLANGASTLLSVTISAQTLVPNTYVAQLTLLGKLPQTSTIPLTDNALIFTLKITAAPSLPSAIIASPTPAPAPLPLPTTPPTGPVPAGIPTATTPSLPQVPNYAALPLSSTSAPITLRAGHSMAWDEKNGRLYLFGGIDDNSDLQNDLWSYNPVTNSWKQLLPTTTKVASTCGNIPTGRINAAMVWDTLDQQLLLYGGTDGNGHYFGDFWSYTPISNSWHTLQCSNNPPGMRVSSAVWTGHQMLLLDGINTNGILADFWSYTPGPHGNWQQIATTTPPGPRAYNALAWDSLDSRLYLFGGITSSTSLPADLWSYTNKTGWLQISITGTTRPAGRQQASMAWDSTHNVLLVMGGWIGGQALPDATLWAFTPVQNAWDNATPTDSNGNALIPARAATSILWSDKFQRAFIYAGTSSSIVQGTLNDLWELL